MNDDPAPRKPAARFESGAGAPGTERQASGRDGYPENETAFSCSNMEFDDFDTQSEYLAEYLSGRGRQYIKLSTGPFRGRFVAAFLGRVAAGGSVESCCMSFWKRGSYDGPKSSEYSSSF